MANSGIIKSVTSVVKAIAVDGAERILQVGDTVLLNEEIITGDAGSVSIWLSDGTKLDLAQNTSTLLNKDTFKQGLGEVLPNPVQNSVEDEVAAIQQALADDQTFDPTTLEAPAAGGVPGGTAGPSGGGHSIVGVNYLNPEQTPDSGFEMIGINVPILDFSGEELILEPSVAPIVAEILAVNSVPAVQVTDHNGLSVGDNEVLEGATTSVSGDFEVDASEGVLSITVAGIEISEVDLFASGTSPIDIATAKGGVLSIDGYNEASGVVSYSYLPNDGAKDHSAGDNSIVDQFEITVTDVNNVTSSPDVLDILIKDTAPEAFNNVENFSNSQKWFSDNVVFNERVDGDNAVDDVLSVDVTKLQSASFEGVEEDFLNPDDLIHNIFGDFIMFNTDNGMLLINEDGKYLYKNTDRGDNDGQSTDKFDYQLVDADGDISIATLTINQVIGVVVDTGVESGLV